MKRQILLSQFGAALSALWIGCVPAALGQAIPRGGSLIVTQDPCAPCVSITGEQDASVINNFKQTLRLPCTHRWAGPVHELPRARCGADDPLRARRPVTLWAESWNVQALPEERIVLETDQRLVVPTSPHEDGDPRLLRELG